jgi:chemotaxis protein methyltransferase CheR
MELSRETFDELRRLIHRVCGIVLSDDKTYLVQHRLEPLVRRSGGRSFEEFRQKLSGGEATLWQEAIIEAITTQETSFFRDRHPFETLRRYVLPELVQANRVTRRGSPPVKIRLWCAGAATGQEPYSLAIVIHEFAAAQRPGGLGPGDFSILATDISTQALAAATAAEYHPQHVARGLSPSQLQRFFEQCDELWVVRPALRKMVEFRRVNLTQPFLGLGTFDAILCRNVLIYFDEATRRRICDQFYTMLADGGWLVLGSAENLYGISDRFQSQQLGESLLYRKPPRVG